MAHSYGVLKGTISNHIQHVAFCLYKVLKMDSFVEVIWPEANRRSQEGLVYGFPKSVAFVDGTR